MHQREREKKKKKKRDCVCWLMGRVENGLEGDLPNTEGVNERDREGWLVFLSLTQFLSFSIYFTSLTR